MKIAIYAGSFDPFTNGHLDIVEKASKLFDNVVIVVAPNSSKEQFMSEVDRIHEINIAVRELSNVILCKLPKDTMIVELAEQIEATHLIRGLRNFDDLTYEQTIYNTNKNINHNIETIFFMPELNNSMISSSMVRELHKYGRLEVIENYVPDNIYHFLKNKKNQKTFTPGEIKVTVPTIEFFCGS